MRRLPMIYTPFDDGLVAVVFSSYPEEVCNVMLRIRELIFQTSKEIEGLGPIQETLRRGEPSYITPVSKRGSTIRIDWKEKTPDKYYVFFSCSTKLISTFREIYPSLTYQGNRAIVGDLSHDIPQEILKQCIRMAFTYHDIKHTL